MQLEGSVLNVWLMLKIIPFYIYLEQDIEI
jgi:hypothetical protein